MRIVKAKEISVLVGDLCVRANINLRSDVLSALRRSYLQEKNKKAKNILAAIIGNAKIAKSNGLAICQDTGVPCVFLQLGAEVLVKGDLKQAINKGVELGYRKGFLRNSIVRNPILRGRPEYCPAVIHIDVIRGRNIKIAVLPKGFGCENKSQLKMFNPTAAIEKIKDFIVDAVKAAGPNACPPYIVGIGIGGTADYAALLAKKALLRNIAVGNTQYAMRKIENDLLKKINSLNIGPMGLGGKTTALAVNIETFPTHIAGLPVAVNISCHALRSAEDVI